MFDAYVHAHMVNLQICQSGLKCKRKEQIVCEMYPLLAMMRIVRANFYYVNSRCADPASFLRIRNTTNTRTHTIENVLQRTLQTLLSILNDTNQSDNNSGTSLGRRIMQHIQFEVAVALSWLPLPSLLLPTFLRLLISTNTSTLSPGMHLFLDILCARFASPLFVLQLPQWG